MKKHKEEADGKNGYDIEKREKAQLKMPKAINRMGRNVGTVTLEMKKKGPSFVVQFVSVDYASFVRLKVELCRKTFSIFLLICFELVVYFRF